MRSRSACDTVRNVEVPRDQRIAMIEKGEELSVRYPDF
jgi:hypothetical protein